MTKNNYLNTAKATKNDEFYTQLEDIENELKYYKDYFKGKVVYCNCDGFLNEEKSNFFVYFSLNYEFLGLKGLICTKYNSNGKGKKYEYYGDLNGNNYPDEEEIFTSDLEGDGDFRSEECIELLKKCDIVCTNPPFSLFRQYVAQLFEYNKDFLIIGNVNAISYKEVFPMIKENKMWLGYNTNKSCDFIIPDNYVVKGPGYVNERGAKHAVVPGICWFTNLDIQKRHDFIHSGRRYARTPKKYPKYDNYDAINVDKTNEIPDDYDGVMGVPITFMDKYSPDQFEIIGLGIANLGLSIGVHPYKPEHKQYRKEIQKRGAVDGDLYMLDENGNPVVPYARVLIRRNQADIDDLSSICLVTHRFRSTTEEYDINVEED